jgi:hypothetical protein
MARRRGSAFLPMLSGFLLLLVLLLSVLSFASPAIPAAFAADPTADAPATSQVTSQGPTAPPVTQVPTTVAPPVIPTEPVPTTPAQTDDPVEPAEPVVPAQPTTPEPSVVTISPDLTSDTTHVWPWVLAGLGALVLVGGIIWFARSSSRRTDEATAWRSRRLNAYAEGAALHDAILSASSGASGASAPGIEAGVDMAQWAEIQRRSNDFTQRLYQLREAAPDQDGQLRVEEVLASLQTLRSAMDTERASGPVHGMTADITRERLNDFRVSLYGLRDPEPS